MKCPKWMLGTLRNNGDTNTFREIICVKEDAENALPEHHLHDLQREGIKSDSLHITGEMGQQDGIEINIQADG